MDATTAAAFAAGSGVDPSRMKAVLTLLVAAVAFAAATWCVVQLINAYRNDDRFTTATAIGGIVRVGILLGLVIVAITLV